MRELLIVTGLSGAGKSLAMHALEDIGYYCIDNIPANLLVRLLEFAGHSEQPLERAAIVLDVRGARSAQEFSQALGQLRRLVLLEGAFSALLLAVVLVPVTIAFAALVMPGYIANLSWVSVYTFDVRPLWITLPVLLAVALLTPLLCLRFITKGTIQQRLGATE